MSHDGDYKPNADGVAADQLRAFIERIEAMEAEIKDRNDDKSEIYAEAKSAGFNVKAMKKLVTERRADPDARAELDTVLDLYRRALDA